MRDSQVTGAELMSQCMCSVSGTNPHPKRSVLLSLHTETTLWFLLGCALCAMGTGVCCGDRGVLWSPAHLAQQVSTAWLLSLSPSCSPTLTESC